ncbi:MAG: DUF6351 family protein [Pseudomonadota bacterium]
MHHDSTRAGGRHSVSSIALRIALTALCSLVLLSCSRSSPVNGSNNAAGSSGPVNGDAIHVLSNRADLINGGDALVQVTLPAGVTASAVKMDLNGKNITSQFSIDDGGKYLGLVSGLALGRNLITAKFPDGSSSSYSIVNHPQGGPVISGPQLQPWTCRNAAATDAQCNQPVEYTYLYKSTDPTKAGLQSYDPENPASDVATTTTQTGVTVPFIVRVETGYQDRDQYKIAVLYQPDESWSATKPQPQFNHKLVINHGFSCGVEYQSGNAPIVAPGNGTSIPVVGGNLPIGLPLEVLVDATKNALGQGFAVMSTALNNSGHNCNVAVQAESMIMAKERVIEQYGTLRYTIGQGCSGGSLAMQWVANAYPGIYQGILPTCSFPDAWSVATQFADYHLTLAYFLDPSKWASGVVWLPTQMADVQGHVTIVNSIVSDNAQFHVVVPTDPCAGISDAQRYDPMTNPSGVRCSVIDASINLFGPRPSSVWSPNEKALGRGFGGLAVDNVGVQYGLGALQNGTILADQFIDLNTKIGGLDVDINPIPARTAADEPALSNAYRTGLINETNNLNRTAIIDCRGPDPALFHDSYRAFAVRARLDREHGNHDNQMIWEGPIPIMGDNECAKNSFVAMDRWLSAVEKDVSATPLAQKIVDKKPADIKDACFDGIGQKLTDGLCPDLIVPVYGTPRMVAGDAISTDTNKCQLKPLNRSDNYGLLGLSDAQWAQMQKLFPDGVCDYSKPGVSQQGTIPWQTYQKPNGKVIYGGTPLPTIPANSAAGWAGPAFSGYPSFK